MLDIILSINDIKKFTANISSYEEYVENDLVVNAVERKIGIIGEAINKAEKEGFTSPFKFTRQIVGLRNRIVHSYDQIDQELIWKIVVLHLDELKQKAETLLQET